MISLAEQLKGWRSRHRLTLSEAASVLDLSARTIEEIEQGIQILQSREREALAAKLDRLPRKGIKGPRPDAGYRPGEY